MKSLLFFLILPMVSQAETLKVNFDDLPKLVSEKNEHSKGAKEIAESAEERTDYLLRSYLPTVEAKVGQENFKTGSLAERSEPYGGVEARINVFNSGRDSLENQIRKEEHKAATATATHTYREELTKVRKVYWELVYQKEIIKLLQDAIKDNDKNLGAANTRIKAGIASQTDRLEFEMAKVELEQDLARAKLQQQNFERDFRALLNLSADTGIETVDFVNHQHEDGILKSAFDATKDPSIQTEQVQAKTAELQYKKDRSEWLPSVDVVGSHSLHTFREREFDDRDDRWESVIGVQLSMKLFDGWNSQSESASHRLRAEGLSKQARQSANELSSRFEGARAALQLNHELIHDSEAIIDKGRKYMTRSLDEYRRGVKNSLDILNASQRFFELQKRYADLRKDYQLARTELLKMLGM